MALDVTLSFPASSVAQALSLQVHRVSRREAMSALFELTLELFSTDPAIDMATVVGLPIVVGFGDEPFLPQVRGIVRRAVQLTAVPTGTSKYAWTVVPPLWLATRRRDHRIFQHLSVPAIVAAVLADPAYKGRIPAPIAVLPSGSPTREYRVQYGETDHDFVFRLLAEEGIATFFDHANGGAFTLIEDTSASASTTVGSIPFSDPSNLNPIVANDPDAPHVSAVALAANIETSLATLRDYDFERPRFLLQAKAAVVPAALLPNEADLESYSFEVGRGVVLSDLDLAAVSDLGARRVDARTLTCQASFALPPGSSMTLADHPRSDVNIDLLVVGAITEAQFGGAATHTLACIDLGVSFRPPRLPKPRIHGTQTAFVVGAPGEEIDVDGFGRVEVEFSWDRRDLHTGGTSRRVRVSQGWAGAGFGFVMLPRVGDEVIVAYLDGDPDQPIIVGRVHNALERPPQNLPADKTVSVWRSCSSPGGGGFNQVLMDDKAGAERLELHAQRDFTSSTGRNAATSVGVNQSLSVGGDQTIAVTGNQSVTIAGMQRTGIAQDYHLGAQDITIEGQDVKVNGTLTVMVNAPVIVLFNESSSINISPGSVDIVSPHITLSSGASSIDMTDGEIVITSPMIKLNP